MQRIQGLFRVLKIVIFSGVYSCGGFMRQATARLSPSDKTRYCFRIQHIALGIEGPFVSKGFVQSAAVFVFSFGTYQRLDFSVRPISIEPHPLFRLKPRPPHKNGRVLPGPYPPPHLLSPPPFRPTTKKTVGSLNPTVQVEKHLNLSTKFIKDFNFIIYAYKSFDKISKVNILTPTK